MRTTRPDDLPIVVAWLRAFAAEALDEAPHVEDVEHTYRRREADPDGAWLVWDDGGPVSLAGYGNPTPSGTRVGPVYTPPEHRGRGYATSLVAELTAERLAAGSRSASSSPTSLTRPRTRSTPGSATSRSPTGISGRSCRWRMIVRCRYRRHVCTHRASRSASRSQPSPSAAGECSFPERDGIVGRLQRGLLAHLDDAEGLVHGRPGEPRRPAHRHRLVRRRCRAAADHARPCRRRRRTAFSSSRGPVLQHLVGPGGTPAPGAC